MAGEEREALRLAGLIHDIGKIAVPAEILAKPGRLSEVEFNLIRQHPQSGFEILEAIDFGGPVAELVLQHHERLDGSGYPGALTAPEILPGARILAVADVVEAMSSHRPYRAALGMEAALAEVQRAAPARSTTPRWWSPACASSRRRASRSRSEAGAGPATAPAGATGCQGYILVRLVRRHATAWATTAS